MLARILSQQVAAACAAGGINHVANWATNFNHAVKGQPFGKAHALHQGWIQFAIPDISHVKGLAICIHKGKALTLAGERIAPHARGNQPFRGGVQRVKTLAVGAGVQAASANIARAAQQPFAGGQHVGIAGTVGINGQMLCHALQDEGGSNDGSPVARAHRARSQGRGIAVCGAADYQGGSAQPQALGGFRTYRGYRRARLDDLGSLFRSIPRLAISAGQRRSMRS